MFEKINTNKDKFQTAKDIVSIDDALRMTGWGGAFKA